jgi:(S)-ureidoglycine aminohydrolase
MAQTDSIVAGVYTWNNAAIKNTSNGKYKKILEGSSKDLANLEIHTLTLQRGKSATGNEVKTDLEKLIIVKEGNLTLTINDTSKVLGPGSFAVIIAGDKHGFKNGSAHPTIYYSLTYTARAAINIQRGRNAGGSFYKDWKDLIVKQTDKGESRPIFDRPSSMFSKFDMHATALNPGIASHDPHMHRAEEIILMIKGEVQVQIAQNFLKATDGDVIFYPAYSLHAVKNTGIAQCGYFAIQWRNE